MGKGREGDWECSGCNNRNYAFRSLCNRCKHPRLLVDSTTPPNSKWLPRIGDWICTGCTNNNYASREKCKKCGQLKEVGAMAATAVPGVAPCVQGGLLPRISIFGTNTFQQSVPPSSSWSARDQLSVIPNGWRNGDWICHCGFHNYSSRSECKECNATQPALGIKRQATDEPMRDWENKRQNAGIELVMNQYMQSCTGSRPGFIGDQPTGLYSSYPSGSAAVSPSMQGQLPQGPTLIGKGAKQWRDGDWMCSNCSNHNYASRSECNRCKTQRSTTPQRVGVA